MHGSSERASWRESGAESAAPSPVLPDLTRTLLDSMTEGVSLAREDGTLVYTNAALDRMFGYAPGELIGRHVSAQNAYPDAENARIVGEVIAQLKAVGSWTGEWLNRRKDGATFVTTSRISAVEIEGEPHWLCVQEDVTEAKAAAAALAESQVRLELATGAADIGIWDWDVATGRMTYCPRARAISGFAPDQEITYEDVRSVTHPDDYPRTSAMARRALDPALRENEPYRYRVVRPDGSVRWVIAHGQAVFAETGGETRAVRYVGTLQDITEQVRLEAAERDHQARLAMAIEAGRMAVWELDLRSDAISGSLQLNRVLGFPDDAAPSAEQIRAQYYPGELDRLIRAAVAVRQRGEKTLEEEFRYRRPDGARRWLWLRAEAVLDDEAQPVRAIGVIMDVTERKEAEIRRRVLIELSDRFRDLDEPNDLAFAASEILGRALDVSRVGYGTVDPVAETIAIERDWNAPGVRSLTGVLHFRDYGNYIDDLKRGETVVFDDADTDPRTAATAEALKAISAQAVVNMPVSEKEGLVALLYLNHATARNWTPGELALIREVAERTRAAIARREAEVELRELNATLEARVAARNAELREAQEALLQSQKMEAIGQLVSGLAHDFNNLLGAVVGAFELIRRRADEPDQARRFADAGLQAAERGAKLTSQLLAFSRSQRIKLTPILVCDVIEGVQGLLERTLGAMISLRFELNPAPVPVLADPTQVEMMVLNLAINARDAMPEGGRLTIATRVRKIEADPELAPGEYVEFSVADSGVGMDEQTLRRAMDPFFTTKSVGKGTGLGLAQVYGSARQAGGTVRIESTPGEGTCVRVLLPCTTEAAAADPARADATGADARPPATILLVDDDPDVRNLLADTLRSDGHTVLEASGGALALAALEAARPDLLLVDFAMPDMNGAELAREVRERWPQLPIVFASGFADTAAIERVMGPRATVLRKPFRAEQLFAAIGEALRAAADAEPEA